MTFQAYLNNIEKQTGVKAEQWVPLFKKKSFPKDTKATPVTDWLTADYKLSHAYGMAIVRLLRDKGVMS